MLHIGLILAVVKSLEVSSKSVTSIVSQVLYSLNIKYLLCSHKAYPNYLELKPVQKMHHLVTLFFFLF